MSRVSTGMEIDGLEEMNAELERYARRAPHLGMEIVTLAAEAIASDAQTLAPVATGFLVDQHLVEARRFQFDAVIVANTDYAAAVHANHPSKAGWLRNTLVQQGMDKITAAAKIVFARGRA